MKDPKSQFLILLAGIMAVLSFIIAGCSESTQTVSTLGKQSNVDVNLYPMNKLVCDPFGGGNPELGKGLKAKLFYLRDDQPRYDKVEDYFNYGINSVQTMFFTELNVPTRMFSEGFPTQTGGMVKDDQGNFLFEYFAIRFSTVLKLGPNDTEGDYEFAILSDDGAIMSTRIEGTDTIIVNNDGVHPTRMGCGTVTLNMTKDSEYLVDFMYYQGPRYHISLIPLWRKVGPQNLAETECGKLGNNRFFDPNNGSKPLKPYQDILARGWKPISAVNYNLPISAIFNPCVQGENPEIDNVRIYKTDGEYQVDWDTNIPATSQVLIIDPVKQTDELTVSDNKFCKHHSVRVKDPKKKVEFKAISISETFGKNVTDSFLPSN